MEENNSGQSVNPSKLLVQTHPVSNPPNNQKGFFPIILGVLILLLVVGGGAYYLGTQRYQIQPISTNSNESSSAILTTEPTVNQSNQNGLKVYQGQTFTFQYPEDWTIVKSDAASVTLQKEEMMEVQGPYPAQKVKVTLSVYSSNVQPETTLDEWFENRYLRNNDKNLYELTKEFSKETTLGGEKAIVVQVPGAAGYIDEGVVSVYNGKGYDISIIGSEIAGSAEAYQTVRNTFKFAIVQEH